MICGGRNMSDKKGIWEKQRTHTVIEKNVIIALLRTKPRLWNGSFNITGIIHIDKKSHICDVNMFVICIQNAYRLPYLRLFQHRSI